MVRFFIRKIIIFIVVLIMANAMTHIIVNARARTFTFSARNPDAPVTASINTLKFDYANYLRNIREDGDLGNLWTGRPVAEVLSDAIIPSLVLVGAAMLVSSVLGVGIGIQSISPKTKKVNPLALMASFGGFSMPSFYMGIVVLGFLIWMSVFKGQLWIFLPISGYGLDEHLILPVLVLAARPAAEVSRYTAELLAEELPKDYVRAARAKGLRWRLVVIRHALPNIAATVATTLGNSMRYLLSSLIVVEILFLWPGLGRLLVLSVWNTDNPQSGMMYNPALAAGTMTVIALIYLISGLISELIAHSVDPRARRFTTVF